MNCCWQLKCPVWDQLHRQDPGKDEGAQILYHGWAQHRHVTHIHPHANTHMLKKNCCVTRSLCAQFPVPGYGLAETACCHIPAPLAHCI